MTFNENVSFKDIKPVTIMAILVTQVWFNEKNKIFHVTSINDSKHMKNSKHYTGEAFDIRIFHLSDIEKADLYKYLVKSLYKRGFDIVNELTHFHVEYDPKGRRV